MESTSNAAQAAPKTKVFIVPDEKTGNLIRTNADSESRYAYLVVRSEETAIRSSILGNWVRKDNRSTIVGGDPEGIKQLLAEVKSLGLFVNGKVGIPGRLRIVEKLESEITADEREAFGDYLEDRVKRAGSEATAPICMKNGEKIYQFKVLVSPEEDAAEYVADTKIQHDNTGEIRGHAKIVNELRKERAEEAAKAELRNRADEHANAISTHVAGVEDIAALHAYAEEQEINVDKGLTNITKLRKAIVDGARESILNGAVVL